VGGLAASLCRDGNGGGGCGECGERSGPVILLNGAFAFARLAKREMGASRPGLQLLPRILPPGGAVKKR
jgi:hypothetical protein